MTLDVLSRRGNELRSARRRRGWGPVLILAIATLIFLVTAALFPSWLTDYDPLETDFARAMLPPSFEHLFGTDKLGRDVFTRIVYGARLSLSFGLVATVVAVITGSLIGVVSGLAPRGIDLVMMRLLEVLLALPELLIALVVVAFLGPGMTNVVIAITVAAVPTYARLVRATTLQVRYSGFVEAEVALGHTRGRIILRTILPNVIGPLLVLATIGIGTAIIAGSSLSFLGLGPQMPSSEWGLALSEGRGLLSHAWWVAVFPGLAISTTVLTTTFLGQLLQTRFEGTHR